MKMALEAGRIKPIRANLMWSPPMRSIWRSSWGRSRAGFLLNRLAPEQSRPPRGLWRGPQFGYFKDKRQRCRSCRWFLRQWFVPSNREAHHDGRTRAQEIRSKVRKDSSGESVVYAGNQSSQARRKHDRTRAMGFDDRWRDTGRRRA